MKNLLSVMSIVAILTVAQEVDSLKQAPVDTTDITSPLFQQLEKDSLSQKTLDSLAYRLQVYEARLRFMAVLMKDDKGYFEEYFETEMDCFFNRYVLANKEAVKLYDKKGNTVGWHVVDKNEGLLKIFRYNEDLMVLTIIRLPSPPPENWHGLDKITLDGIGIRIFPSIMSHGNTRYYKQPMYDTSIFMKFTLRNKYDELTFGSDFEEGGLFSRIYVNYHYIFSQLREEVYHGKNELMGHGIRVAAPVVFYSFKMKKDRAFGFELFKPGFTFIKWTLSENAHEQLQTNFVTGKNGQWKYMFDWTAVDFYFRYKNMLISCGFGGNNFYNGIPLGIEFNMEVNQ